MTLLETTRDLMSFDQEYVICAVAPFAENSQAIVVPAPESGLVSEIESPGFKYFLEVSIAREVLDGWRSNLSIEPTLEEKCARLIKYANTDA